MKKEVCLFCKKKLTNNQDAACSLFCRGKLHSLRIKGEKHYNYGKHLSEETKTKIGRANAISLLGKHCSVKTEFKHGQLKHKNGYSFGHKEKNPRWSGGIYGTERHAAMGRCEYKCWRTLVFNRDGYMCLWCGQKGGRLNADHILSWSMFPDLRYDLTNGRTLCSECHKMRGVVDKFLLLSYLSVMN